MTSWGALWDVLQRAVQNPVVLLAAASVFNAVTDPTTAGVGDSRRALGYKTPNRDK
ncbi:phage holin [Anaerotruncus colihominis]